MLLWKRPEHTVVGILSQEGDFRFCLFSDDSKFCCCSEFDNGGGVWEEMFTITLNDSVDKAVVQRMLKVLVLHIVV